jgi:MFS family permease
MHRSNTSVNVDRWPVYISAGSLSFCGMMGFTLLPLIVSSMEIRYGFRAAQAGDAVALFFAGITFVALTSYSWVRRYSWRNSALLGQLIGLTGLGGLLAAVSFEQVALLLFVAGAGFGVSSATALTVFGDSRVPDRAFAVNMLMQSAPGAAAMIVLPLLLHGSAGDWTVVILFMLIATAACSLGALGLPPGDTLKHPAIGVGRYREYGLSKPVAATVATFLFMSSCTAPWIFMDDAIAARHLSHDLVSIALGGSQATSIVGALAAMILAQKWGRAWPVILGSAVSLAGIALVGFSTDGLSFALGACLSFLSPNFLLAYSLGLTSELDRSGRLIAASNAALLGAPLVLPPIAGRLYTAFGFSSNLVLGAVALCIGAALYLMLCYDSRQKLGAAMFKPRESNTSQDTV